MAGPCRLQELDKAGGVAACRCGWHRRLREDDKGHAYALDLLLDAYIRHRLDRENWEELS